MATRRPTHRPSRLRWPGLALSAAALLAIGTDANARNYKFTDLGLAGVVSNAYGINNSGQVVGEEQGTGVVWTDGAAAKLSGSYPSGVAINNGGQVAGNSWPGGVGHATRWGADTVTVLGNGRGAMGRAFALNDFGRVAGVTYITDDTGPYYAMVWDGTSGTELRGLAAGDYTSANGINNAGQVVGSSGLNAVVWNGSNPTDLGFGEAAAVNDVGQIVGSSWGEGALLWHGTAVTYLGCLDNPRCRARDINNAGDVVGAFSLAINDNDFVHAALWQGTTPIDLNRFLDARTASKGWYLFDASGVNDGGWITGIARNRISGIEHAFLLVPQVPEPSTYLLLLGGLAVLGMLRNIERAPHPEGEAASIGGEPCGHAQAGAPRCRR